MSDIRAGIGSCILEPNRQPLESSVTTLRQTQLNALIFLFSGAFFISAWATAAQAPGSGDVTRLQQAEESIEQGRYPKAIRLLRALSEGGSPAATNRLGQLYYLGKGLRPDADQAFRLFDRAAQADNTDAMFWLGRMYLLGEGPARRVTDADRQSAIWFFEAARRGHAEAQYFLALLFLAGTGVEREPDEAVKWLRRSAASGHPPAMRFLEAQAQPAR